jgi:hypothetical protein
MNAFLIELDASSGGFLFRNGALVELLIGLLQPEPQERTSVRTAFNKLQVRPRERACLF